MTKTYLDGIAHVNPKIMPFKLNSMFTLGYNDFKLFTFIDIGEGREGCQYVFQYLSHVYIYFPVAVLQPKDATQASFDPSKE